MDLFDFGEIGSGPLDLDRTARSRSDPLDPDPTAQATQAAGGGTGSPVVGIAAAGLSEFNIFSVPGLGFRRGLAEETAGMMGNVSRGSARGFGKQSMAHSGGTRTACSGERFQAEESKKEGKKGLVRVLTTT